MLNAEGKRLAASSALAIHGSVRKAAAFLGIPPGTFQHWAKVPAAPAAPTPPAGTLRAAARDVFALPQAGQCKTYILTSAQNNTPLHEAAWRSLNSLAAHDGAQILVARFTYATKSRASSGQKSGADKSSREGGAPVEAWDDRLTPFLADRSIELAPGLVWCGELQILPTATDPTAGLESYTGRASSIVPHVKFSVKSIASPKMRGTKFIYTTGTITQRNYIQKKAGQKAGFHHGYGALIVEVCDDGAWFVRQLNADSEGVIYDLDRRVLGDKVTDGHRPEALVWGDIHTRQLASDMRNLGWGEGKLLDTLLPRRQVLHDVLDFRSQNHHDRKDPWHTYAKHVADALNVSDEINEAATFIADAARPWCETAVVASNHDEALIRWLKEADYREDPENAEFILEATAAAFRAIRLKQPEFYPVEWAFSRALDGLPDGVRFLRRDEEYIVCDDANGGLELSMHGDKGANGAPSNLKGFARSGRKCIVAHSHTAGLHEGAMQVGVMGSLDQGYNVGQSSWSHTNALVYPNGKRTLFTIWRGRWHGRQKPMEQAA